MKLLFIGTGSIGSRHINIIQNNYDHQIFALRSGNSDSRIPGVNNLYSWAEVDLIQPEVAFICNPSELHIETALQCAERGMALFIEKPLDTKKNNLGRLKRIIERKGLTSYVAYPFRHHQVIKIVKDTHKDDVAAFVCWTNSSKWPGIRTKDHRLLELSHEIDLAFYIFGGVDKIMFFLKDNSPIERRYIWVDKTYFDLLDKADMYERQLEYFFKNINNPRMMNNIFEASEIFRRIIEEIKCEKP